MNSVELKLTGSDITVQQVDEAISEPSVRVFEFEGLEQDSTVEISSKNLIFAIGEGTSKKIYKAESCMIEFEDDKYTSNGDYVFIDTSKLNIKITNKEEIVSSQDYDTLDLTELSSKAYIFHKKYVNVLYYKDVPESPPKTIPNRLLKLYISEKEEYKNLNEYLEDKISESLPIHVELDIGFTDNMENTKEMIRKLFTRNIERLEIVQEMQEDEFIETLYEEVMKSSSLKEMQPILNQDSSKDIELIKEKKGIEQWILDVRRPWDEQKNDIIALVNSCKDNSLVISDYSEFLIEFRFKTSFQIKPVI